MIYSGDRGMSHPYDPFKDHGIYHHYEHIWALQDVDSLGLYFMFAGTHDIKSFMI